MAETLTFIGALAFLICLAATFIFWAALCVGGAAEREDEDHPQDVEQRVRRRM